MHSGYILRNSIVKTNINLFLIKKNFGIFAGNPEIVCIFAANLRFAR